jgi:hypothetical protein
MYPNGNNPICWSVAKGAKVSSACLRLLLVKLCSRERAITQTDLTDKIYYLSTFFFELIFLPFFARPKIGFDALLEAATAAVRGPLSTFDDWSQKILSTNSIDTKNTDKKTPTI